METKDDFLVGGLEKRPQFRAVIDTDRVRRLEGGCLSVNTMSSEEDMAGRQCLLEIPNASVRDVGSGKIQNLKMVQSHEML